MLSNLELLSDDVLGYQITYLPFTDVKQLCETSKRLHNFCLGTSSKQSNTWRNIIYNTFGYLYNYNDILLKLSDNCDGPCYNYFVYVNFINYLDKVTQLMIYYKQGDLNSFESNKYTDEERFLAFFMLGDKEGMRKYEHNTPYIVRRIYYLLLENKPVVQLSLDHALRSVSFNGHLEIVKYLVELGADVHTYNDYPLSEASGKGHLELLKYLVEKEVDIHVNDDDALKQASMFGSLEMVKYLIEHGVSIHALNSSLVYSSRNGKLGVVKYLVEHGANINAWVDKAFRDASKYARLEVVKYLVEQGTDIRSNDDEALGLARRNKNKEHYSELVEYLKNIYQEKGWKIPNY